MEQHNNIYPDDTIDLVELIRLFWKNKLVIITISFICGALVGIVTFTQPLKYEVKVLLQPVSQSSASGPSLGGLGSLATVAGINIGGGGSETTVAKATLSSQHLLTTFIQKENLSKALFPKTWDALESKWIEGEGGKPSSWDSHLFFKENVLNVSEDNNTGLVVLSITWTDPDVAVIWAHGIVELTNTYLQEEAKKESERNLAYLYSQFSLTSVSEIQASLAETIRSETERAMMANVAVDYAFKIIDPAVAPDLDNPSYPRRVLMIALGIFFGGILGAGVVIWKVAFGKDKKAS